MFYYIFCMYLCTTVQRHIDACTHISESFQCKHGCGYHSTTTKNMDTDIRDHGFWVYYLEDF